MGETKRILWADVLKGFLILLVVLGHSIQAAIIQLGGNFVNDYLWNLIYSFHMPAFMAMSGYLAFRRQTISAPLNGSFVCVGKLIWRRFRQLMIPFFIWSIAIFFANHNVDTPFVYLIYPNKSLWFLWALFFIVAIFIIVDFVSKRTNVNQELLMTLTAVIMLGITFVLTDAKRGGIEYVAYYYLYYILGYYLHKYEEKVVPKSLFILVPLGALWFLLGSVYSTQGLPKELYFIPTISKSVLYYFYRILTASIAIVFLIGIAKKCTDREYGLYRRLGYVGQISLGIYAVHMVLRFLLVKAIANVFFDIDYLCLVTIEFFILTIVTIIVVSLLRKWKQTSIWLLGKL